MRSVETSAGRFIIGSREELFRRAAAISTQAFERQEDGRLFLALSGGSTPVDWYRWCVATGAFTRGQLGATEWFTSDERHVPLENDQSNFGTADRMLLTPLGVVSERKHPWPVDKSPGECAMLFEQGFSGLRGSERCFDVCFLGLGTDGHTASMFPGGPIPGLDPKTRFTAVEAPGKGSRLTITPNGLRGCGTIAIMVFGSGKRNALDRVVAPTGSVEETPARILRGMSGRVIWLVDDDASEGIAELRR